MGTGTFYGRKREIKLEENGSYTVEAAFIVPIVLGIAFLILYTLFLQHDRVILQANLDNTLFLTAEGDDNCKQECQNYLQKSLWCMEIQEAELSDGMVWIQGNVEAEAFWKVPVLTYFINGKQKLSLSESYSVIQPEEIIRYGANFMKEEGGE